MSIINNPDKNKSAIQRSVFNASKELQSARNNLSFKRFLKFDEDKKRIDDIKEHIKEAEKIMDDLKHIIVHDKYWHNLRTEMKKISEK